MQGVPVVAILSGMDIQVYLDRIGYHGPLAPRPRP